MFKVCQRRRKSSVHQEKGNLQGAEDKSGAAFSACLVHRETIKARRESVRWIAAKKPFVSLSLTLNSNDRENCRLPSFDPLSAPPSLLLHIPPYSQLICSSSPLFFFHFSLLSCDLFPIVSASLHPGRPLRIILPLSTSTLPSICLDCLSWWTCIFNNHLYLL